MNQVHGHEVMQMIMSSDKKFTRETLLEEIGAKFGEEARFHSCSQSGMTADQIVGFFESMGKLRFDDGGHSTDLSRSCDH
ncbi:MAG: YecH family metal-binding protein [Planctomycetota bacterium]|jgi:probable metal-binding protein